MRKQIKPLIEMIDKKLANNGLAQQAIKDKDARALVWLAATALVGIKEKGNNTGPEVSLIQSVIDGPDSWPWCMSMVQTCLMYAEHKTGKKSPIFVSEHCVTVWQQTSKAQRVKYLPLAGAIAIWQDVGKQSGHTEIVLSADKDWFLTVGGNTSGYFTRAQVQASNYVEREGNAVVYAKRSMKSSAKRKLLGFLKSF